jgi:hypothetical protein
MATCPTNKIDSNITGLRVATEECLKQLPATGVVWTPLEPNSYGDFGAQYKTTARNAINPSRQRQKGAVTDMDASVNYQTDFTGNSLRTMMDGFLFAAWRNKTTAAVTAVIAGGYTVGTTAVATFNVGDLVFASGFTLPENNGLKLVTAKTTTALTVAGVTAEATAGTVQKVGVQAGAGDLNITVTSGIVALNSTTLNLTTLGLIPGEWVWVGGDAAGTAFTATSNNGFYRVQTIAANKIVFDRVPSTAVADAGTGATIQVFIGDVVKNESDPALIKRTSYQFERSFGATDYEYVAGCVPNSMEINVSTAEKLTVDLGFLGSSVETTIAAKTGTRPALVAKDAFNSSSDMTRLRLVKEDTKQTLFTYVTELKLSVNNNAQATKAVGVLGAMDVSVGDFVASGNVTAFYTSADAANAVKNNSAVSLDFGVAKNNTGWLFDVPYVVLGDGRRKVEKDQAVQLPLSAEGAEHPTLHHTMLVMNYAYLPTVAEQ